MKSGKRVLTALVLGMGIACCSAAGANPLIGKWHATTGLNGTTCTTDRIEFTSSSEIMHNVAMVGMPELTQTTPVTYDFPAGQKVVFVYANGNHAAGTSYTLYDANTIRMEDGIFCIYKRG